MPTAFMYSRTLRFPMSAAEDLLYYDDIMKGEATQHDMGRHRTT